MAQTLIPTIGHALGDGLNRTDLAVLERYADPRALLGAGRARLLRLVRDESRGKLGDDKVQALRTAAEQALQLWGEDPAIALSDLAEEITTEIRLLRLAETERARHEAARDAALAHVDPDGLATSLPGLGPVEATQLLAAMERPGRFRHPATFKSFTGLTPKASETGNTDRKSQPMSKAGNSALRTQLIQSANTARQLDPQLAAIYHAQMTQRGAPHLKALCVVAARLAERAWLTLSKAQPYVIRDLQGRPISPSQARELIAAQFTVPANVRRRRRSNKLAGRGTLRPLRLETGGRSPSHPERSLHPSRTYPPVLTHRLPAMMQTCGSASSPTGSYRFDRTTATTLWPIRLSRRPDVLRTPTFATRAAALKLSINAAEWRLTRGYASAKIRGG
ncbi:MAG TPA: transposase, partial [Pseudonocardiaceae bacterium]|nr:transposase [Pseudonocardiaceae bacterium]